MNYWKKALPPSGIYSPCIIQTDALRLYFELTGAAPYILIHADIFISMNLWLFHRKPCIACEENSWFNRFQRVRNHRGLDYSNNGCEYFGCCVCFCICRCLIMNQLQLPPLMTQYKCFKSMFASVENKFRIASPRLMEEMFSKLCSLI